MADFTATRSYIYVAGNVINPTQNNKNESDLYSAHNAAVNETSGHKHSGGTGDGPLIPLISPQTRVVTGVANNLLDTDVVIASSHTAARQVNIIQTATSAFKRYVTICDYDGNASSYNITCVFSGGWTCFGETSIVICEDYGSITFEWNGVTWNII